jgi:hypothetical protein
MEKHARLTCHWVVIPLPLFLPLRIYSLSIVILARANFVARLSEIGHGERGLTLGLWLNIFAPQAAGNYFFAGTVDGPKLQELFGLGRPVYGESRGWKADGF